jgi:hypothetical protein
MDFKFFETLSQDQAQKFLTNFLTIESQAIGELLSAAESEGLVLTLATSSVRSLFEWVATKLRIFAKAPDTSLPRWITASDSYNHGLFVFDEPSKVLILRTAYFLGASFVTEYPQLKWSTGNRETALQNMPVISGFRSSVEMPPMLVAENLLSRIVGKGASIPIVDTAIGCWVAKI